MKDGRILFIYKRFIGETHHDEAPSCLAARYSSDNGETWTDDRILATREQHQAVNLGSVSLMRMANGDIGWFYNIRYGWHDVRLHLRRSSDEGESWSEPICCISETGYFVVNNDRVVRLSTGRLLIPACKMKFAAGRRRSSGTVHFYFSDDDGRTWKEANNDCSLPVPRSERGLLEPGVVELSNGVVWAWSRTDK
ncbi:MAG: hypothetical protein K0Q59_2060, partial [Paenibacillus sp.]|nr:hypothetical protein [Paenibacillus sp.]